MSYFKNKKELDNFFEEDYYKSIGTKEEFRSLTIEQIIKIIRKKKVQSYLCNAGINSLSVSTEGDIYPCYVFNGIDEFKMGNVYDDNTFNNDEYISTKNRLLNNYKSKIDKCRNCFVRNICKVCYGYNYFRNSDINNTPEYYCKMNKEMVENILIGIAENDKKL